MFNHHRGLWGYSGTARDGDPLTIQSTGMGGASAAIVAEELIRLGAETLIRIGTCGVLVDGIELGTLVPVDSAARGGWDKPSARLRRPRGGRRNDRRRARTGSRATAGDVRVHRPLLRPACRSAECMDERTARRSSRWKRQPYCKWPVTIRPSGGLPAGGDGPACGRTRPRELRAGRGDGARAWRDCVEGARNAGGLGRRRVGDRQALLRARRHLVAGRHGLANGGEIARELIEARLEPLGELGQVGATGTPGRPTRAARRAGRPRPRSPRAAATPTAAGG